MMSDKDHGLTRRGLLGVGLGTAAFSCIGPAAIAAEAGKLQLADYEKIKPQEFPWGWIRWLINDQLDPQAEMTMGLVYIEPRQSNPQHIHPNSAEFLHVLSGGCEHFLGKRVDRLRPGDTLRIPQGVPHHARTLDSPCLAMIVYNTGRRQMTPVGDTR